MAQCSMGSRSKLVLSLKYTDSDGDLCSLVEDTLSDCLSFIKDGMLKLVMEIEDRARHPSALTSGAPELALMASPAGSPRSQPEIVEEYEQEWAML